jgi:hypothetical protein
MLIWLILLLVPSRQLFAKDGMATDEKEFFLAIMVLFLLAAGFFEGIDYLKKNGKTLLLRFRTFLRSKILTLRNSH